MLRELRDAVWARAAGRCERCGQPVSRANWEAHVHHQVYRGHGAERLEDLLLLCVVAPNMCHGREHPQHRFYTRSEQERRARRPKKPAVLAGLTRAERRSLRQGRCWAWRPPE